MPKIEDLFTAYRDARRHKRNTDNQIAFEINFEEKLFELQRRLKNRTWEPGQSVAFIINQPVKREVFAAPFSDRVIHHLFFNLTNEIFERSFIHDSYSCRKGKGTLYGIHRLDHHIRSCSHNYTRDAYVMKLDLSGYFMSINRELLYKKVRDTLLKYAPRRNSEGERFGDALDYNLILFLARQICLHDPLGNCYIKGSEGEWEGLPADKSLYGTSPDCGLPIGNLTSQLFSNVYLNEFDNWVKRSLRAEHFGRYVDDFYIVHTSKEFLLEARRRITEYLYNQLGIRVHPHKIYVQNILFGVTFLGAIIKPFRLYAAGRLIHNFRLALTSRPRLCVEMLRAVVNSYLGLMRHYATFDLRRHILDCRRWVYDLGFCDGNFLRFCRIFAR